MLCINILSASCELLSKFISLQSRTVLGRLTKMKSKLWIAFKICIFAVANSFRLCRTKGKSVVNCFQNLYLCSREQLNSKMAIPACSCELLSKFVSLQSRTVTVSARLGFCSCELLSKFVSLQSRTVATSDRMMFFELWIAFKICIFAVANSQKRKICEAC